jgi:hypothetical protein
MSTRGCKVLKKLILRIAGFLDFVHRPVFQKTQRTNSHPSLSSSWSEGMNIDWG